MQPLKDSFFLGEDKYEMRDINEVRKGFKTDIFNKIKSDTRLADK